MDSVLKLLDELEDILDNSRTMPFSSKISIDKELIHEIITEIRLRLPNELKQSKWVIEERNKIIVDAQKEAEELVQNAQEQLSKMIDEHEITKKAYEQAAEIVENSKITAKQMRIGAMEYADEVLSLLEDRIRDLLDEFKKHNNNIEKFLDEQIRIIYENRQELRGGGK